MYGFVGWPIPEAVVDDLFQRATLSGFDEAEGGDIRGDAATPVLAVTLGAGGTAKCGRRGDAGADGGRPPSGRCRLPSRFVTVFVPPQPARAPASRRLTEGGSEPSTAPARTTGSAYAVTAL